jgi:hypothetical protein
MRTLAQAPNVFVEAEQRQLFGGTAATAYRV